MGKNMAQQIAAKIESFAQASPKWVRNLLPKPIKDKVVEIQWNLSKKVDIELVNRLKKPQRPILLISIPKCGTYLLRSVVLAIPGTRWRGHLNYYEDLLSDEQRRVACKRDLRNAKSGDVYSAHLPYDKAISEILDELNIARVFIYRDPRDYTVSAYHDQINEKRKSPMFKTFLNLGSNNRRLMACIEGLAEGKTQNVLSVTSYPNVNLMFRSFLGWQEDPNTSCIQFEDFSKLKTTSVAGKEGEKVKKMLEYLQGSNLEASSEMIQELVRLSSDPSRYPSFRFPTFRLGKKGTWRDEYTNDHLDAFKRIAGDLLIELGYELNDQWSP